MKVPSLSMLRLLFATALPIVSLCTFAQTNEPTTVGDENVTSVTITVPSKDATQQPVGYDWRTRRHSLNVTVGAPSLYSTLAGGHSWRFYLPAVNTSASSSSSKSKGEVYCGGYAIEYTNNVLRWLAIGVTANYECWLGNQYDTHDAFLMAVVNFTYINHEHIRLYSGVNTGFGMHFERKNDGSLNGLYLPALSLTPIGVHAGGKNAYALAELSVGAQSFFRVGVGAHF